MGESDEEATKEPAPKVDLAIRNTGLAFQRTRLAAERTLMAVVRTALALVSFGFTIFTFFHKLHSMKLTEPGEEHHAAARFGISLVLLGVGTLIFGIFDHARLMRAIDAERRDLLATHMLYGRLPFGVGALLTACALLAVALIAVLAMLLQVGPLT